MNSNTDVARMRRRLVAMLDGGPAPAQTTEAKPQRRAPRRRRKRDTPETPVPEVTEADVCSESQSTHAGDDGS